MGRLLTSLGTLAAHPAAFIIVAVYGVVWICVGNIDWHGGATLSTWLMTLFIQRAEHRDTQAIQAKLDELLKANRDADEHLQHVDEKEPEEIERLRLARTN